MALGHDGIAGVVLGSTGICWEVLEVVEFGGCGTGSGDRPATRSVENRWEAPGTVGKKAEVGRSVAAYSGVIAEGRRHERKTGFEDARGRRGQVD